VLINEVDPIVQKTLGLLNRLIELQKKSADEANAAAMVTGDRLARTVYAVEVVALILAVLVAWTITRSIVGPLRDSVSVARRVASGDLTSNIVSEGRDEAAELLGALREMNDGLGRMVSQIRSGADSIAVGAGQVAAGNQQLSSRTEEHASSLEETASTLEEFMTTVRQHADPGTVAACGGTRQPAGEMPMDGAMPAAVLARPATAGTQLGLQVGDQQVQRVHVVVQHHAQARFACRRGMAIEPAQVDAAPDQGIAGGYGQVLRHGRLRAGRVAMGASSSPSPT